ncbi:hypothetical protein LGH82_15630 [Mesorhizobium sp. PAMC28654]|uniref:glycosyltransferase family 8 protein n=1 Tax=Mesorhizobium sp. PAMC28654 TaxID=2880934 RepID=UPI001D0B00D4|nr:glycosyltransferase [Mesorhizobium sp. PAMC28654]UDL92527.1 hypothetical protein LGH82_15630 [Mesorhizobium sp. PAMC28654]
MKGPSRHDTAVIFVTDNGYLGPSLLAALQLTAQGVDAQADILIYTVGIDPVLIDTLQNSVGRAISFIALPDTSYVPPDGVAFAKNHVPVTSLARLVIAPHLAPAYQNIVYLDGDIQIVGDVTPLIRHRVRDGWIAAGRGSAWFDPDDRLGLNPTGYFDALNGATRDSYFNAGVLACRRDTWAIYGPRALDAFFRNSEKFIRHDQSALNAVFQQHVEPLSPAYNFHNAYAGLLCHRIIAPKVIHFTGAAKPWKAAVPPWGWHFHKSYVDLIERFPELASVFSVATPHPQPKSSLRGKVMALRGARHRMVQRRAFRTYVKRDVFAVR